MRRQKRLRKNAALSSKAHRHSSPLVHRAKRRISVSLPYLLSFYLSTNPSVGKMDAAEKSDGGVCVMREGRLLLRPGFPRDAD